MEADDADDPEWMAVYGARERFFADHFGPIEGDVQKLMNLSGVWPGGCLVQVHCARLGLWVTSSFGLTNRDMPATCSTESYKVETADGQPVQWSMRLVAREPRQVPLGLAGYGYEVLLLTPAKDFWPLMFLNWAVPAEILHDVDILGRVHEVGALTIEDISLGDGSRSDFIVAPLQSLAPATAALPNGAMHLLVATAIHRSEMEFALERGQMALLERLAPSPDGQVSRNGRPACVQ